MTLCRLATRLLAGLLATAAASAAPLPSTPDTILEQIDRLRQSRDRPWDPDAGRLGNLRHVQIVAPGCTVRIVSGPENRVLPGRSTVQVIESSRALDPRPDLKPVPRDVVLKPALRGTDEPGAACFTLQVATAHDFLFGGDGLAVLFDRVELPGLRLFVNPSANVRMWFQDIRLGWLSVSANAAASIGGSGRVEWLTLDSSQASSALLFHDMDARRIGVSATTTRARFSIRIGEGTHAGYYQPARAPGDLAKLYPIWIDGPVAALEMPAGRVNPLPITEPIRDESRALRDEVLRRAGPVPRMPAPDLALVAPALPPSPRQQVADALAPLLPPGVTLSKVDLWKRGGAIEGLAPDVDSARGLPATLSRSGQVTRAQLAFTRPEGDRFYFRLLFDLACDAPGEPGECLPAPGGAYTESQVRDLLLPLIGPTLRLTRLQLRDGQLVLLEGEGADADVKAAFSRIASGAPWLRMSSSGVGRGTFSARLQMACPVPPKANGLCAAPPTSSTAPVRR